MARRGKKKNIYGQLLVLFALIVIVMGILGLNYFDIKYAEDVVSLDGEWEYYCDKQEHSGTISLPGSIKGLPVYDKVTIEKTLPNNIENNTYLLVRNELQRLTVRINDEVIYSLEDTEEQLFGAVPASRWNFIALPEGAGGQRIKITYSSEYNGYNGSMNEILIGGKSALIVNIINKYIATFLGAIIMFGIGIVLSSIFIGLLKIKGQFISFLYLALINIFASIWIMCDSKIIELFLTTEVPIAEAKMISMYLTAILFLLFYGECLNCKKEKPIKYLLLVYCIYVPVVILLYYFNIVHFVESLIVFHMLLAIEGVLCLYYSIREVAKKNAMAYYMLGGISILIIASVRDISSYYLTTGKQTSSFSKLSFIIFSIVFFVVLGKEMFSTYNSDLENRIYKKLAYTDGLTGLGNREAFDAQLLEVSNNKAFYNNKQLYLFDLNCLKFVNDNLGHKEGDRYILECTEILKSAFAQHGDIYRIGGDEFVFIAKKQFDDARAAEFVETKCSKLKARFNNDDLGVAYGGTEIISEKSDNPYNSYAIADEKMYIKKHSMKNKNKFMK